MKRIKHIFTVPEGEKVTEKQLLQVLIASLCTMLLTLVCLVSTTWAWFAVDLTNAGNDLHMGAFMPQIMVDQQELKADSCVLQAGQHPVTIASGASTSSGYCVVVLEWSQGRLEYTTDILSANEEKASAVSFTVDTLEAVTMTVTRVWGAPAYSPTLLDATIVIPIVDAPPAQ